MIYNGNIKDLRGKSGVYRILCLANGRFYIGSSANLVRRKSDHVWSLSAGKHGNPHLQAAWNKHGSDNFTFDILELCPSDDLISKEQLYLDRFTPYNREIGYNMCPVAYSRRGIKSSEETKQKLKILHKGRKMPEKALAALKEYVSVNGYINEKEFCLRAPDGIIHHGKNISEFERKQNVARGLFRDLLKGRANIIYGWTRPDHVEKEPHRLLDIRGNLVLVKNGELEAFSKKNGLCSHMLRRVLRGVQRHCNGWSSANNPHYYISIVDPQNVKHIVHKYHLAEFVKKYDLDSSNFWSLVNGKVNQCLGWTLESSSESYRKRYKVKTPEGEIIYIPAGKIYDTAIRLGLDGRKFYRVVTGNRKEYAGYQTCEKLSWIK